MGKPPAKFRRGFALLSAAALAWLVPALGVGVPSNGMAGATTLEYDSYRGNSRVGRAEVVIERDGSRYEIRGKAWSEGLARLLSNWESSFLASGTIEGGEPVLEEYRLIQTARNKHRRIVMRGGETRFVREDLQRVIANPPESLDFLSALFLTEDCGAHAEVHNGKDAFRLTLRSERAREDAAMECVFEVIDEDDERITATIELHDVDGLMVPVQMDFSGALEATFKLRG